MRLCRDGHWAQPDHKQNDVMFLHFISACTIYCGTWGDGDRKVYRDYVHGLVAALFLHNVQGQEEALKYITDADLMPVDIKDFKSDLQC